MIFVRQANKVVQLPIWKALLFCWFFFSFAFHFWFHIIIIYYYGQWIQSCVHIVLQRHWFCTIIVEWTMWTVVVIIVVNRRQRYHFIYGIIYTLFAFAKVKVSEQINSNEMANQIKRNEKSSKQMIRNNRSMLTFHIAIVHFLPIEHPNGFST